MFITRRTLPRRTFLRGMGVTLALPLLDAMAPALTAQGAPPVRFGAIYVPHGMLPSQWAPAETGRGYAFSPILQPLEPFRDDITLVTGLTGGPTVLNGGHAVAPASYLTGNVQPNQTESAAEIENARTIDQVIADAVGRDTPIPSLEVATEDFSTSIGACDTGYSCIYMNTIAWAGPTSPLPMETNPRVVFERMFGGPGTAAQREARLRDNRSILDDILDQVGSFRQRLDAGDRTRLAGYLESIREIERRIQNAEQQAAGQIVSLEAPVGPPEAFDEHVAILFELLAAAFETDVTRVFTFMMMRDVTGRSFPHIGVPDPHHALSHEANGRSNDPEKPVRFARVNTHFVSMFGRFVERLKNTPDGDGSLLDHSMVLFGSGMGNANDHTHSPLPTAVLGHGGGRMRKPGEHIAYPPDEPMANLLLALAQKTGAEVESFGLSTGPMDI